VSSPHPHLPTPQKNLPIKIDVYSCDMSYIVFPFFVDDIRFSALIYSVKSISFAPHTPKLTTKRKNRKTKTASLYLLQWPKLFSKIRKIQKCRKRKSQANMQA
jgi:hypothetical protein